MIKITIQGDPIPQKRPRFVRKGSFVSTYDMQKKERSLVKQDIIRQLSILTNSEEMKVGIQNLSSASAVSVNIIFYLPAAKSDPQRNARLFGFLPATRVPDIDNLVKFILDCCNGVMWKDDSIVTNIFSCKIHSENPKTEIIFMPLKDFEVSEKSKEIITCFTPNELDKFLLLSRKLGAMVDKNMYELDLEERRHWIEDAALTIAELVEDYGDTLKKVKKKL